MSDSHPIGDIAAARQIARMTKRRVGESWWRELQLWGKLSFALVAVPAWLFIVYCVLTGRNDNPPAYVAFAVFAIITILLMKFNPRGSALSGREGRGVEVGGGE